jgi:hypothetical protein
MKVPSIGSQIALQSPFVLKIKQITAQMGLHNRYINDKIIGKIR